MHSIGRGKVANGWRFVNVGAGRGLTGQCLPTSDDCETQKRTIFAAFSQHPPLRDLASGYCPSFLSPFRSVRRSGVSTKRAPYRNAERHRRRQRLVGGLVMADAQGTRSAKSANHPGPATINWLASWLGQPGAQRPGQITSQGSLPPLRDYDRPQYIWGVGTEYSVGSGSGTSKTFRLIGFRWISLISCRFSLTIN